MRLIKARYDWRNYFLLICLYFKCGSAHNLFVKSFHLFCRLKRIEVIKEDLVRYSQWDLEDLKTTSVI